LKGSAVVVIEGFVEEEDVFGGDADGLELAMKLVVGVWTEAAAEQGAEVLAAQVHLDGSLGVKRQRGIADRATAATHRTDSPFVGPFHQRRSLAEGEHLLAIRAVALAGDPVPRTEVHTPTAKARTADFVDGGNT